MKVAALLGHIGIEALADQTLKNLGYEYDIYSYGGNYRSFELDWTRRIQNPNGITLEEEVQLKDKITDLIKLDFSKYDAFMIDMHDFVFGAFISTNKPVVCYPCIMSHQWQQSQIHYWKHLKLHERKNFKYVVNDASYMAGYKSIYPEMTYHLIDNAVDPNMPGYTGVNQSVLTVLGSAKNRVGAANISWEQFKNIAHGWPHFIAGPGNEDIGGRYVTKQELSDLYRDSRVCLNVFANDVTIGFVEMLMSGAPIVTFPYGQAVKYLTDGVNAIISKDLNYLNVQLNKLMNDLDYAKQIGNAGKSVAMKHFNLLSKILLWRELFE